MTKLTDKKIHFLCKHIVDVKDWSVSEIAIQYGVTERRVRQLTKEYKDNGKVPCLDRTRRPSGPPLTTDENKVIDEVWEDKRFGARLLHKELTRRGVSIPRHKIHKYLVETRRSIPNPKKQKKRRRCRYERKHSFSLAHGDWHRTTEEVLHAEGGPPLPNDEVWVGRLQVAPCQWHRASRPVLPIEPDLLFPPSTSICNELELLIMEGVEGMRHSDRLPLNVHIRCS